MTIRTFSILFTAALFLLSYQFASAQELRASVRINTPKLQKAAPELFEILEGSIRDFYNNTKWTNDVFEEEERIEFQVQITIQEEISDTRFKAEIAIQSSRPIFNSAENTQVFSHVDKEFTFEYQQYQPLIFSRNVFNDNLTSLLAFYAYIVIGNDYDTFSALGGENYFKIAQEILNTVPTNQAANYRGWRARDGNRNRFWLVENYLNPRIRPLRLAMYEYHLKGLDKMHDDPEAARAAMTEALTRVDPVIDGYPNAMVLQTLSNAKASEIIEIYKNGSSEEKNKVRNLMSRVDPANASRYQRIGY